MRILATVYLLKHYRRVRCGKHPLRFLLKTMRLPTEELLRTADAVWRFGAENFYR